MHTTSSTTHPRRRVLAVAALAIATLVVLSGCVKVEAKLHVHADDTIDGTMTVAIAKSALSTMGTTFDAAIAGSEPFETDEVVSSEPYEDDEFSGRTYTLAATPLDDFGSDGLSITHADGVFTVDGTYSSSDEEATDPAADDTPMGQVSISMTFPGTVTSSNGTIDGSTVTWTGAANADIPMEAVAKDSAGLPLPLLIGGGLGALLLIGLIVGSVVLVKRRRSAAVEPVSYGWGQPYPQAPGAPVGYPQTPGTPTQGGWAPSPPQSQPASYGQPGAQPGPYGPTPPGA